MFHSHLPIFLVIASCLHIKVESLGEEFSDLVVSIAHKSPECTVLLHKLDARDANAISNLAGTPVLIANDMRPENEEAMQTLASARNSRCVVLFSQIGAMDETVVEYLLNRTKHRTVFLLKSEKSDVVQTNFQQYFMDSVILIQPLSSGYLSLTRLANDDNERNNDNIIWNVRKKSELTAGVDFTMYKNMQRSTLRGKNVTASVTVFYPFTAMLKNKTWVGLDVDIFKMVADKVGFVAKYKEEDYTMQMDPKTRTWIGSVGSIANGRSQVGFLIPLVTGHDMPIDHGPLLYNIDFVYLVPKPKPLKPFDNFVRPFSLTVWICFLATWLACSLTTFVLNKYRGDKSLSFLKMTFDLYGTIWQQNLKDTVQSPHSLIFYIIFGFWIVGMTFKGTAYCCNLRAFIVMKEYEKPLETDEDIVRSGNDVAMLPGSGQYEQFANSPSPAKRAIAARTMRNNCFSSVVDRVDAFADKFTRGGGVRVGTRVRTQFVLEFFEKYYGYQPLQATKYTPSVLPFAYAMQTNQPWNDQINSILLELLAAGLVDFYWRKDVPVNKYALKESTGDPELEPYKIEHVAGPLVLLTTGLILSLIVACLERAHFHAAALRSKIQKRLSLNLHMLRCSQDE